MNQFHRTILGITLLRVATSAFGQRAGPAGSQTQVRKESGDGLQWTIPNGNGEAVRMAVSTDSNRAPATCPSGAQAALHSGQPHKLGPLTVSVNWRFRTEAWDWFQPATGQNSLLQIGVGQKSLSCAS